MAPLNFFLNLVGVVLVLVPTMRIAVCESTRTSFQLPMESEEHLQTGRAKEFRDIYYLILDGYAGAASLRNTFDFDNGPFPASLIERGFVVVKGARCNYFQTHVSLASSLNMQHMTHLTEMVGKESKDRTMTYGMIRNNKVMSRLSEH